jgi:hypothetical protein
VTRIELLGEADWTASAAKSPEQSPTQNAQFIDLFAQLPAIMLKFQGRGSIRGTVC